MNEEPAIISFAFEGNAHDHEDNQLMITYIKAPYMDAAIKRVRKRILKRFKSDISLEEKKFLANVLEELDLNSLINE